MAGDEHLVQRDDLHRLFARVLDRKLLAQRAADRGQLRPGLAGPRAGVQPADEPQEVHRAPRVAERVAVGNERRHDVDVSQRQGKLCRQHAHDDERLSVDSHGASDGVGVAAEPVPPEAVTEDRHVRRIGAVVALLEEAARRRRGSQDLERVGRHARPLEPFGGAVAREACAPIGVRREARQRARAASVVQKLRQRERCVRVVGPHRGDPDQPFGRGERQRPDEHGVHDRENGGRRPDGERERQDDGQRESRVADLLAERYAEIVHDAHGDPRPRPNHRSRASSGSWTSPR